MRITERRNTMGLTQSDLAEKLGVERSTVAKWESGAAAPRAVTLLRLAKILQCPAEELFEECDDDTARDTVKR